MTTLWLTSDTHFGHKSILKYRSIPGVTTVAEHDEAILTGWNETVSPRDTVIVLGDFALGERRTTVPIGSKLHGRTKVLIPGNHDYVWEHGEKSPKRYRSLYKDAGFMIYPSHTWLPLKGRHVVLSHMPYRGEGRPVKDGETESVDSRFQEHMLPDRGHWMIHGHVHDAWKQKDRMINVGVDVWDFRPVALDTLSGLISD